jgi:hypothetical protein
MDVAGRSRLIQAGVPPDTRRTYVSGRTRLIETGIAMHVACLARLVDPRIAGVRDRRNTEQHEARYQ